MTHIPEKYKWLLKEPAPKMLVEALKLVGIREIVGLEDNPEILSWAKGLGIDHLYKNDELAWCGLAHAIVIKRAGKLLDLKGWDILRALQYIKFGVHVDDDNAMLSDTLVFKRKGGGGHVCQYVGETDTHFHCLGGNQFNAFGFTEIEKDRLVAVRRPDYKVMPKNVRKIFMDSTGNISTNES
jgi:uncharacterized protein (TIGR02594 family)